MVMGSMRAMVLESPGGPLVERDIPMPEPRPDQVLVKVAACGGCRTDLHVVDGELPHPKLPFVPGHEIVGTVVRTGDREAVSAGRAHRHPVAGVHLRPMRLLPQRAGEPLRVSALHRVYD